MKYVDGVGCLCRLPSPPSRGAWIEIRRLSSGLMPESPSPPSRGAWIEMQISGQVGLSYQSPPSRGAWIEILLAMSLTGLVVVAPLAGGVD